MHSHPYVQIKKSPIFLHNRQHADHSDQPIFYYLDATNGPSSVVTALANLKKRQRRVYQDIIFFDYKPRLS